MKRKIVSLIICICLVLCALPIFKEIAKADIYTEFSAASATYSGNYSISTVDSLKKLATVVNSNISLSGVTFYLASDINLNSGITFYEDGTYSGGEPEAWTPIGNNYYQFSGIFEGNNHTISGIYINGSSSYQGLFGGVSDGTVKNLTVDNSYIKGYMNVGGVVGEIKSQSGTALLDNCYNSGTICGTLQTVGGIAGNVVSYGGTVTVQDCRNAGSIIGEKYSGGVAGAVVGRVGGITVQNCSNSGSVSASGMYVSGVGGVVGSVTSMPSLVEVKNCFNTGSVTGGTGVYVGGVAGSIISNTNGSSTLSYCYNSGTVTSSSKYTGGVAGYISGNGSGASAKIQYCYNTASVAGSGEVGGVVGSVFPYADGYTGVQYCYNCGSITSIGDYAGGIAGRIQANHNGDVTGNTTAEVQYCFNTNRVTGHSDIGSIAGNFVITNKATLPADSTSKLQNCYYDKQMSPMGAVNRSDIAGSAEGCLTSDMTGADLQSSLGTVTNWTFTSDLYPRLADNGSFEMDETESAKVSVSPLFLASIDTVAAVTEDFLVGTASGVSWASSKPSVVSILGDNATKNDVDSTGVTLTATFGTASRTVDISRVTDYYSVTYVNSFGTGALPTQADVIGGGNFIIASGDSLTREGFSFIGWHDGTNTYVGGATYTMDDNNVNLTAVWKADAPSSAPTFLGRTDTTLTVAAVTGYEYSITAGNTWQTGNVFSGLSSDTSYSIVSRVAASGGDLASDMSPALSVAGMPTVSSISPSSGSISGGKSVTISGTHFVNVSAVFFGSKASAYTVISDTEIIATVPRNNSGVVDITVTTACGTSYISTADQFEYFASNIGVETEVKVDGKSASVGTTTSSTDTDGKRTVAVTLDTEELSEVLKSSGSGVTVTIAFKGDCEVNEVILTGQMLRSLEDYDSTLVLETGEASYLLPSSQIDIGAIASRFGTGVSLAGIKVSVKISEPSAGTERIVENAAEKGKFEIVVPPVDFTISYTYNGQTIEESKFSSYVTRLIAIPSSVDPSKITTAVVLNSEGTLTHVPTQIVLIDGAYYAKINSLTNSSYTLIWHPVEFADAANHWAKDAINNMGSRMVVTGDEAGNYNPDAAITRAEFAAVVVRALGLQQGTTESSFGDVTLTDWFNGYVDTATAYSLITGYDGTFYGPNDKITREQAMAIIARAMKLTGLSVSLTKSEVSALLANYRDGASVSDYAATSVAVCLKTRVVTGSSDTALSPKASVTRAEVAVMVHRMLQKSGLI